MMNLVTCWCGQIVNNLPFSNIDVGWGWRQAGAGLVTAHTHTDAAAGTLNWVTSPSVKVAIVSDIDTIDTCAATVMGDLEHNQVKLMSFDRQTLQTRKILLKLIWS